LRVVEAADDADLADEAGDAEGVAGLGQQALDRDGAADVEVLGALDDAHAAGPEHAERTVAVGGLVQQLDLAARGGLDASAGRRSTAGARAGPA
jgi:hypothetical protein